MQYSPESTLPLPVHSNGHPGHRRSFAHNTPTSQGPFASLGNLPRAKITPPTPPKFHIVDNDSDTDGSDSPPPRAPQVKVKANDYARHSPPSSVAFPTKGPVQNPERSTTCSPVPFSPSPANLQPRSAMTRTSSSPVVLLSNGKPLKSSLKARSSSSSSTSLSTSSSASSLAPGSAHIRAASAPSTPRVDGVPSPIHSDEEGRRTPTTPKNVHFAPADSLRDIRLFSRSAKPAAVSSPTLETETDTEGTGTESERFSNGSSGGMSWASARGRRWPPSDHSTFPFPKIPVPPEAMDITRQNKTYDGYALSAAQSSPIPSPYRDPSAFIHTEVIKLVCAPPAETLSSSEVPLSSSPPGGVLATSSTSPVTLEGSVLVRNISYQKSVCIRFTLDNWQTTSEVSAYHVRTLTALPPLPSAMTRQYAQSAPSSVQAARQDWDRFEFKIPLSDYPRLHERTLWMVCRFNANGGEWWDNNRGSNYKICFEKVQIPVASTEQPTPTANPVGVDTNVTGSEVTRRSDFERHMAEVKARHSLTPLVTMPLRLPVLPRRRKTFQVDDKESDDESDGLPTRSMKTKPVAPAIDTNVARPTSGGRDRSGSGTYAQSAEGSKVMQGALDRLNLRNYARPRSVTTPSAPPAALAGFPDPAATKSTVQFPTSTRSPQEPPKDASASQDETRDETVKDKDSATSTPETSPLVTTPPLSRDEPHVAPGKWPWTERSSPPLPAPSTNGDFHGDKALRAFLQQWCFATTPDIQEGVRVA